MVSLPRIVLLQQERHVRYQSQKVGCLCDNVSAFAFIRSSSLAFIESGSGALFSFCTKFYICPVNKKKMWNGEE